jgi:hypothetical protein
MRRNADVYSDHFDDGPAGDLYPPTVWILSDGMVPSLVNGTGTHRTGLRTQDRAG